MPGARRATSSRPKTVSRSIRTASARPSSATCESRPAAHPAARITAYLRHPGTLQWRQPEDRLRETGASTVALTLDIYSHVLPQADQEAADRIAALIER